LYSEPIKQVKLQFLYQYLAFFSTFQSNNIGDDLQRLFPIIKHSSNAFHSFFKNSQTLPAELNEPEQI